MTWLLVAVTVLAVAQAAWSTWVCYGHRTAPSRGLLEERLLAEVVVTLKSGSAFRGLLHSADERAVVLRNAQAIGRGGEITVVDGELIVLVGDVEFVQRP